MRAYISSGRGCPRIRDVLPRGLRRSDRESEKKCLVRCFTYVPSLEKIPIIPGLGRTFTHCY